MTDLLPRLFAISDLHLPGSYDKSMDLFGSHWQGHFDKIKQDWLSQVGQSDIVLIPGDISWAMHLPDAIHDLDAIGNLPGRKVLIKGNHDYWWSAVGKVRGQVHSSMYILQNDALLLDGMLFCGTRGWTYPTGDRDDVQNQKIYDRELVRLRMSLDAAKRLGPAERFVALCHYPPFGPRGEDSQVTQLLEEYGVDDVVYGHLHGSACFSGFTGERQGVRYWLTSCDCIGFRLVNLNLG